MSKATDKQWRVQTKASTGQWINRGLFETRSVARIECEGLREKYGFGFTRVIPYVKSKK